MSTQTAPYVPPYDPEELSGALFRDETIDVNRLAVTIVNISHHISWLEDQIEPLVAALDGSDMEDAPEIDDTKLALSEDVTPTAKVQPVKAVEQFEDTTTETKRRRK